MADEARIKANGVLLPTPSDISVEIQDLDGDSVRPIATGVLRRNRIVKREKNFKWIGKVHEYLAVYGRGLEGDFAIEHGKIKAYTDRNFQIFKEMEKKNEKFSPRDMYYYANELMDNGHYKEAIDEYRKFIETNQGWIEDVKGA